MSLQWMAVATFLYVEVFFVLLLCIPFISPKRCVPTSPPQREPGPILLYKCLHLNHKHNHLLSLMLLDHQHWSTLSTRLEDEMVLVGVRSGRTWTLLKRVHIPTPCLNGSKPSLSLVTIQKH